jgi:hypothetical protein
MPFYIARYTYAPDVNVFILSVFIIGQSKLYGRAIVFPINDAEYTYIIEFCVQKKKKKKKKKLK